MFDFDPQAIDLDERKLTVTSVCLDCESPETALNSIAKALCLLPDQLIEFLIKFDFENMQDNFNLGSNDQGELLLKTILFNLDCKWGYSHCSWFHLTRCSPTEIFQEGLLSLPDVINKIWEFLFDINSNGISRSEWNAFKKLFESSELSHSKQQIQYYHNRTKTIRHHHGPNGLLIGDLKVLKSLGQVHYLRTPEIIYSICAAYCNEYGHRLKDDFESKTSPRVIKFKVACNNSKYLSKALVYLYETQQSFPEFNGYLDCGYAGNGIAINREQIQKQIFPKNGDF